MAESVDFDLDTCHACAVLRSFCSGQAGLIMCSFFWTESWLVGINNGILFILSSGTRRRSRHPLMPLRLPPRSLAPSCPLPRQSQPCRWPRSPRTWRWARRPLLYPVGNARWEWKPLECKRLDNALTACKNPWLKRLKTDSNVHPSTRGCCCGELWRGALFLVIWWRLAHWNLTL